MSDFSRAASEPVAGTPAAQAHALLALPVLTWLYPPAEFSLLVVYVAMLLHRQAILDDEVAARQRVTDSCAVRLRNLGMTPPAIDKVCGNPEGITR